MIIAEWVTFSHRIEPTEDGRFRYVILSADHVATDDEGEWATNEGVYETGPAFDTADAAESAAEATISYYHYLHQVSRYEEGV